MGWQYCLTRMPAIETPNTRAMGAAIGKRVIHGHMHSINAASKPRPHSVVTDVRKPGTASGLCRVRLAAS